MNFRQLIQDYFTFSRNERKGITILLVLIFILAVANKLVFYFETPARIDPVLFDSARHELGLLNDSVSLRITSGKLFSFNPNTIDSLKLESLDLPEQIKRNLLKFRRGGGKFYSDSDFRKIYGVTDQVYDRIEPYLLVENEHRLPAANSPKSELFLFDPNTASDDEFLRLGLSGKLIATIRNYQNKGGSYKNKEGFLRMWGFSENQKKVLAAYVMIEKPEALNTEKKSVDTNLVVELNSADSIQLKRLPGIGDKLSKRIVKYRDLLGGFHSLNQLNEVYGLSEQTIQLIKNQITIDDTKIKKMDLNFADLYELAKHPYLQKNLAGQIIKFRTKNGSIRDLIVLRDSMILNIDEYNRLKPYF